MTALASSTGERCWWGKAPAWATRLPEIHTHSGCRLTTSSDCNAIRNRPGWKPGGSMEDSMATRQ